MDLRARAWIARGPNGAPERDTGDMSAQESVTVDARGGTPDSRSELFHLSDARRAAARRLGHKLADKLLGLPSAADQPNGTEEP